MKNTGSININYDYIQKISQDSGVGVDMLFSEFDEAVEYVLKSQIFKTEVDSFIEYMLDDFVENYLPEFRQRVIEGRREDDAYEKHRQKQIDGEA